jgi:hypothetical protein
MRAKWGLGGPHCLSTEIEEQSFRTKSSLNDVAPNPTALKIANVFNDLLPVGYAACASVASFGTEGTS